MVGTPPYDGEETVVREQLRKDPTHQQLHSRSRWIDRFAATGNLPVETCILLKADTASAELSTGQFLLRKSAAIDEAPVVVRSRIRNQRLFRELQLLRVKQTQGLNISSGAALVFDDLRWKDVERRLAAPDVLDLTDKEIRLVLIVRGHPCVLRFAAGIDTAEAQYAHVGEFRITAEPGCNVFVFSVGHFSTLRGDPDYSRINHLALGGENHDSSVVFYLADQYGKPLLA